MRPVGKTSNRGRTVRCEIVVKSYQDAFFVSERAGGREMRAGGYRTSVPGKEGGGSSYNLCTESPGILTEA